MNEASLIEGYIGVLRKKMILIFQDGWTRYANTFTYSKNYLA